MPNEKRKKRKNRNSSESNSDSVSRKFQKQRGPSGDVEPNVNSDFCISDVLGSVNSVLYGDEGALDTSVFTSETTAKMADPTQEHEPTNREIMNLLKGISGRLDSFDKKLEAIDTRMSNYEKDVKCLWAALDEKLKKVDDRVTRLEDKVDGADVDAAVLQDRLTRLEKERDTLREDVTYLTSQSMRNNLIFTGVSETLTNGNEPAETTERKLRQHLINALHVAKETAQSMRFERVHRSPGQPVPGKTRSIIAKFTYFKDREVVRKQWKELEGTNFRVFEQFPPEVVDKRRKLLPKLKEAKRLGKRAYLAYDKLFVDGTPVEA